MVPAVEQVLKQFHERFGRYPNVAQFDEGKEFYNNGVKALLDDHDIHYFSTMKLGGKKAAIVERFNRTLKTRMWKYFTESGFTEKEKKWIDVLPNLVNSYNHSKHRTIGMKPAYVNEENKDEVWTRIYGYPLSYFPKPKFKVGDNVHAIPGYKTFKKGYTKNFFEEAYEVTEVFRGDPNMYKLRDPDDDKYILGRYYEPELSLDLSGLEDLDRQDDELWMMDFKGNNEDDTSTKRKREINSLYTTGSYVNLKSEYMKKLFTEDYRVNPNDGPNSKDLFSRLNVDGYWLTFDDVKVAFIDRNGNYLLSKNTSNAQSQLNFRTAFEKATEEHRKTLNSIVEEEVPNGENIDAISEDVRDEIHRENIDDNIEFSDRVLQLHRDGKFTEQEARELIGITVPKGEPEEKIKYLKIERERLRQDLQAESDPSKKEILRDGLTIVEQNIDDAKLQMRQKPESEEGVHRVREKVREDIRTRFEKFKSWARENLGILSAIAISVAGIITTVVVAGKKTLVGTAKGLGEVGKALAKVAKAALPVFIPILTMLATIFKWGAKGLEFLAKNLWLVAIIIATIIYEYFKKNKK
ncbi:integrase core domain-containing [Paramuricea clavata]|uniref:Integrase core domain-containing n=1 Tax=Paramuricea clavata TaxID=317549 RepID=A0A6S7FRG0_PARCT|nr:integrase core domain-containing [Paramuricea clavata]